MALLLITVHAQIQKRRFYVRREREQLDSLNPKTPTRLHLSLKDGQKADAQMPVSAYDVLPVPMRGHVTGRPGSRITSRRDDRG